MFSFVIGLSALLVVASNGFTLQRKGPGVTEEIGAKAVKNESQYLLHKLKNETRDVLQGLKVQSGPIATYHDLRSGVNSLQHSIYEEQETALSSIRTQKAAYEHQLLVQRGENQKLERFNAQLENSIRDVTKEMIKLRSEADGLMQANNNLAQQLSTIRKNISTAEAFVKQALELSEKGLQQAPELEVLAELEQADKSAALELELKAFASLPHVSMLGMHGNPAILPENIVERLNATLSVASAKLDDNLGKLSAAFDRLFVEGETRRQELLGKQSELNVTLASKIQYKERLSQAVDHLRTTQHDLSKRINALHTFGKKQLGAATTSAHSSLLQRISGAAQQDQSSMLGNGTDVEPKTDAREENGTHAEPMAAAMGQIHTEILQNDSAAGNAIEGKQALTGGRTRQQIITGMHLEAGATQTYKDLFSGVDHLQKTIHGEQVEALQALRAKKDEYEHLLLKQRVASEEVASKNAAIAQNIRVLERQVADLRGQADGLMKDNRELTNQLKAMRRNISMADEFVAQAVNVSQEELENAPELEVLAELASKDRESAHEQELETFAGMSLSMFNSVSKGVPAPENILSRLGAALSDAAAQRDASMAKLADTFDHLFAEGQEQRKALIDQQIQLNATLESTAALQKRLNTAIVHLEDTKKELSARVDALRVFGHSHLGVGAEPVLSQKEILQKKDAANGDENSTNTGTYARNEDTQHQDMTP